MVKDTTYAGAKREPDKIQASRQDRTMTSEVLV